MKKKITAVILTCVLAAAVMAGCGGSSSSASGSEATASSSASAAGSESKYAGQTLNVFLFAEYIPDSVFYDFEDEFGVDVNFSTYTTDEELLAKLQGSSDGTYDVINPGDYMAEYLISQGMLAELNKDQLTNYSNIGEQYLGQYFDPENKYTVPFCPGAYIVGYDSDVIPEGFTSLADLLDPKYENMIVTVDDPKVVIGLINKTLGYSINETDPEKLANTKEKLMEFKSNVYALKDNGNLEGLASGEITIDYTYNGSISGAGMETDGRVQAFYPPEGTMKWLDNLAVLASSEKQELANEFVNYILRAEVDAKIRNEIPTSSPNTAGWELVSDEMKASTLVIDETCWNNSEFGANFDEETQAIYDEMFAEFAK